MRNTGTVAVIADTGGDPRWSPGAWVSPLPCPANAFPDQPADWGDPARWPTKWVPRHRRGCNLAFADGHVRWSPSPSLESQARSIVAGWEDM